MHQGEGDAGARHPDLAGGPPADSPLRHAADLLGMIVGDDSGSRLYWALVDPGLADSADCSFHEYEGTGVVLHLVQLRAGADARRTWRSSGTCCDRCSSDGITEEELQQAAEQDAVARGARQRTADGPHAWRSAWHWTYLHQYRSVDDELKAFEAVTTEDDPRSAGPLPARPRDDAGAGAAGRIAERQELEGEPGA